MDSIYKELNAMWSTAMPQKDAKERATNAPALARTVMTSSSESDRTPTQTTLHPLDHAASQIPPVSPAMQAVVAKYAMSERTRIHRSTLSAAMKITIAKYAMSEKTRAHRATLSAAMKTTIAKYGISEEKMAQRACFSAAMKVDMAQAAH